MNVLQLRQDMEDEAVNKVYISYSQLLHMCKTRYAQVHVFIGMHQLHVTP
jgi:hypothetical protein